MHGMLHIVQASVIHTVLLAVGNHASVMHCLKHYPVSMAQSLLLRHIFGLRVGLMPKARAHLAACKDCTADAIHHFLVLLRRC